MARQTTLLWKNQPTQMETAANASKNEQKTLLCMPPAAPEIRRIMLSGLLCCKPWDQQLEPVARLVKDSAAAGVVVALAEVGAK